MPPTPTEMTASRRIRRPPSVRRGSIYVAVLGTAMIVSMIALAAIHVSRGEVARLSGAQQVASAEFLAQSAIELALARIANDPTWRSTYTSGVEVPAGASWLTLGDGAIKFYLVDDDGDLTDDAKDAVTLYGMGRRGEATSVASVRLQPGGAALNCLDAAIHAGAGVSMVGGALNCNQMVSANGSVTTLTGAFATDVWSTGLITGAVTGTPYPLQTPAREMPDPNTLFDYYIANGTAISISSVPGDTIKKVVLSATNNPYGPTNSQGIYFIDTEGHALTIQECRIAATLVIISPNDTTKIDRTIFWEPAANSLPSLLVNGAVEMKWSGGTSLSEASLGANFNPPGSPYLGATDNDTSDSYPGVIRGLVYVSGNLIINNTCTLEGCVVAGGSIAPSSTTVNMTYRPVNRNNPPPGFAGGNGVRIVPGTWRRNARP